MPSVKKSRYPVAAWEYFWVSSQRYAFPSFPLQTVTMLYLFVMELNLYINELIMTR